MNGIIHESYVMIFNKRSNTVSTLDGTTKYNRAYYNQ